MEKAHAKEQSIYYAETADDTSAVMPREKKTKQHASMLTEKIRNVYEKHKN